MRRKSAAMVVSLGSMEQVLEARQARKQTRVNSCTFFLDQARLWALI